MILADFAAHRAAPPALLGELTTTLGSRHREPEVGIAVLANPHTPLDVLDRALTTWAATLRTSRPGPLTSRDALGGALVSLESRLHSGDARTRKLWSALYRAFPAYRAALAGAALGSDELDRSTLEMIVADTTLPGPVRQRAAAQRLSHPDEPCELAALAPLTQFAIDEPRLARKVGRGLAGGHPFNLLVRHAAQGWTEPNLAGRAHTLSQHGHVLTWCGWFASAGPMRDDLARAVLDHDDVAAGALNVLAQWPTLPVTIRTVAAARALRAGSKNLPVVLNLLTSTGCDPVLLDAALATRTSTYQAHQVMYAAMAAMSPRSRDVDVVLGSDATFLLSLVAAHPGVDASQRATAAELLQAPPATVDHAIVAAGQHLPDTAAAGAAMPVEVFAGAAPAALQSLLDTTLDALLPHVSTPSRARTLMTLAPTFTGTVGELFATVDAIAA